MDKKTFKWMDRQANVCIVEQKDTKMDEQTGKCLDMWTNRQ